MKLKFQLESQNANKNFDTSRFITTCYYNLCFSASAVYPDTASTRTWQEPIALIRTYIQAMKYAKKSFYSFLEL